MNNPGNIPMPRYVALHPIQRELDQGLRAPFSASVQSDVRIEIGKRRLLRTFWQRDARLPERPDIETVHTRQHFDVLLGQAAALIVIDCLSDIAGPANTLHDDAYRILGHAVNARYRQAAGAE